MEIPDTVSIKIQEELKSLANSVDEMVKSFRCIQNPLEESRKQVPEATMQLERINQQTEEATHKVLDMVEQITTESSDIVQDLAKLRKALPATYFKNRSQVRDTFERMETTAASCQETAYAIMEALQFQDITAQQMAHTASLLDAVETKLFSIKGLFSDSSDERSENVIVRKQRAFDPNARFVASAESQSEVDQLISNARNKD
jgi:chemotaxis regulatin CheY-phosphate phosphatase CheZ